MASKKLKNARWHKRANRIYYKILNRNRDAFFKKYEKEIDLSLRSGYVGSIDFGYSQIISK